MGDGLDWTDVLGVQYLENMQHLWIMPKPLHIQACFLSNVIPPMPSVLNNCNNVEISIDTQKLTKTATNIVWAPIKCQMCNMAPAFLL